MAKSGALLSHKDSYKKPPPLSGDFFYDIIASMSDKKQLILMMGGQGVGKGCLSRKLTQEYDFKYIETGAILRQMPPESEICQIIQTGNLVPDELLFDIIAPLLDANTNIILDGFPRKLSQAQWLVANYADAFDIHVLYMYAPTELLIARINKRAREQNRQDDQNADTIRRRLDNFYTTTMPAIDWLRNAPKIKFSEIDANGSKQQNLDDAINALQLQK